MQLYAAVRDGPVLYAASIIDEGTVTDAEWQQRSGWPRGRRGNAGGGRRGLPLVAGQLTQDLSLVRGAAISAFTYLFLSLSLILYSMLLLYWSLSLINHKQ